MKMAYNGRQLCEGKAIELLKLKHLQMNNIYSQVGIKNVSLAFAKLLVSCRFLSTDKKQRYK